MNLSPFSQEKPDWKRLREIIRVLAKYQFSNTLERLGLDGGITRNFITTADVEEELDVTAPARLREALEELGTTFIKLGQVLSTRPDLAGKSVADELTKLQDEVPPVPFPTIKAVLEDELGASLDDLFKSFNPKPIASASIAQVHKAKLKDGTKVAVKIQKPGIIARIHKDVVIMRYLANQVDKRVTMLKYYNLPAIVDEFERTINKELDFTQELHNIERFRVFFEKDDRICAPKVYPDYSSRRVLTMEFIDGVKISEILESGVDADGTTIAEIGTECYFKQIFKYGFFHADPHPGNIFVLPGNRLCFVDFGMMGQLDREFRDDLAELFIFTVKYDIKGIINQMMYMRLVDEDTDTEALKYDMKDLLDRFYGAEIQDIGGMINEFSMPEMMAKHHLKLPRDFILLGRVLSMAEDLGKRLDPHFNGITVAEPMIRSLIKGRLNPLRWADYQTRYLFELEHLFKNMPQTINRILLRLEDGKIKMELEHKALDEFSNHLEKIINRISLSMIIAALIIGSSLILQSDNGMPMPGIGFSTVGFVVFLIAAVLAVGLGIAVLREGRI